MMAAFLCFGIALALVLIVGIALAYLRWED